MDAWAQAFIAEAESGHAGRTLQLVEAVRHERWTVEAAAALGMVTLKAALDKESSAAGRNRILRQWLGKCKSQVVDAWSSLGFPMPPPDMRAEGHSGPVRTDLLCPTWQPIGHSPAVPAPGQMCAPVSGGVAVLDFDQTLTTRHVGVFEDMARINRAFGGAERVELVRDFLARLSDMVTVTVVSRNSRHTIGKALQHLDLARFFHPKMIFGFEDFGDEVPKSSVILERILPTLGLDAGAAIFADDDPSNVREVQSNCPGIWVVKSPRSGMGGEEFTQILAQASRLR